MTELIFTAVGVGALVLCCIADAAIRRARKAAALDAWEKGYRRGWDDHASDPSKRECMGCFESSRHKARREFAWHLEGAAVQSLREEPKA